MLNRGRRPLGGVVDDPRSSHNMVGKSVHSAATLLPVHRLSPAAWFSGAGCQVSYGLSSSTKTR